MNALYKYSLLCPLDGWKATYHTGYASRDLFEVKCPHCGSSTIKSPFSEKKGKFNAIHNKK